MRKLVMLALAGSLFFGAQRAAAAEPNYWNDFGFGVASVATNLVYFPCKLVYAVLGGVTGGLAYGLTAGDYAAAQHIWSPSIGGTWVVTPDMLRGREPFLYAGETYEGERDHHR